MKIWGNSARKQKLKKEQTGILEPKGTVAEMNSSDRQDITVGRQRQLVDSFIEIIHTEL